MAENNNTVTLDEEAVEAIRYAIIAGLSSYGEIERLRGQAYAFKEMNKPIPDLLVPLHPTGSDDTIGAFATALAYLN